MIKQGLVSISKGKNRKLFFWTALALLLISLYFLFKPLVLSGFETFFPLSAILDFYKESLLFFSGIIFEILDIKIRYFPEFSYLVWKWGSSPFGIPFLALRQSFIFILIIIFFHKDFKSGFFEIIIGLLLIYFLNLVRIISMVLVPADPELIRNFFRALLSVSLFYFLIRKIKRNELLFPWFLRFMEFSRKKLILNIESGILLYLSRGFIILLYKLAFPRELLAKLILFETSWIIRIFGAEPRIDERYIFIRRTWVYLGDQCLGIMLIFTFIALILILRARLLNKLIWITAGVFFISLINSARIAAISFHLQNHNGTFSPRMDPHELFSYMVYAAVFIIWVLFIRWGRGKTQSG